MTSKAMEKNEAKGKDVKGEAIRNDGAPKASTDLPLVNPKEFVEPFRNQGINLLEATCENIDNSKDADAKKVQIDYHEEKKDVQLAFSDDGVGMDAAMMAYALQIGSGRRSRTTIGRFGWGLKAAGLSQGRTIEVYSKIVGGKWHKSFIDTDLIEAGERTGFTRPVECAEPAQFAFKDAKSGTLIMWKKTDDLPKSGEALRDELIADLGRIYRRFLLKDMKITLCGRLVQAIDPLYLTPGARDFELLGPGAEFFNLKNIEFENPVTKKKGKILFRWSWLNRVKVEQAAEDFAKKNGKSVNDVKKRWGINLDSQGFSILRDGREIQWGSTLNNVIKNHPDRNYFKAEIQFDPELDEAFGINTNKSRFFIHKKLKARLKEEFKGLRALFEEMRSRGSKELEAVRVVVKQSETVAGEAEKEHRRSPDKPKAAAKLDEEVKRVEASGARSKKELDGLKARVDEVRKKHLPFVLEFEHSPGAPFFRPLYTGETSVVYINTASAFYRDVYQRVKGDPALETMIELMIFGIARAEIEEHRVNPEQENPRLRWYEQMRQEWTTYLQSYLARVQESDKE